MDVLRFEMVAVGEMPWKHRHHPIPRQICRKYGAPEWDPRNGCPIGVREHERHHSAHSVLGWLDYPEQVRENLLAFVGEWPALQPWCERRIPGFPLRRPL